MEPRVLYEATFIFQPAWLILLFATVIFVFSTISAFQKAREEGKLGDKIGVGVCVFGLIVLTLVWFVTIPDDIRMYDATVGAYHRGEYMTVEGYVEDFEVHNDRWETFSVNGVDFEYVYAETRFGYHKSSRKGGVITGDGQHLKIGYTQFGLMGNVIVYIEELPSDG